MAVNLLVSLCGGLFGGYDSSLVGGVFDCLFGPNPFSGGGVFAGHKPFLGGGLVEVLILL